MSRPDRDVDFDGAPRVLDAVETVRSHPQWFFRQEIFNPSEMAALLADEAFSHGSNDLLISQSGIWWTATSSSDWLGGDRSAFFAPTPDAGRGPNSFRVEVVLTAFCTRVVTASGGQVFEVKGTGPVPAEVLEPLREPQWGRVIAFLPPSQQPRPAPDTPSERRAHGLVLVTEQNLSRLLVEAIEQLPRKVRQLREANHGHRS